MTSRIPSFRNKQPSLGNASEWSARFQNLGKSALQIFSNTQKQQISTAPEYAPLNGEDAHHNFLAQYPDHFFENDDIPFHKNPILADAMNSEMVDFYIAPSDSSSASSSQSNADTNGPSQPLPTSVPPSQGASSASGSSGSNGPNDDNDSCSRPPVLNASDRIASGFFHSLNKLSNFCASLGIEVEDDLFPEFEQPMAYEDLIQLDEAEIEKRRQERAAFVAALIPRLPNFQYKGNDKEMEDAELVKNQCSICRCEFENADVVVPLPCLHIHHKECIEQWLYYKCQCPICKLPVTDDNSISTRVLPR